jgi:glutamate synthase domain-containing protein 3
MVYGSAGQSFGAFGVPGLNLTLCGEANDYVGKGMRGGRIVIYAPGSTRSAEHTSVLVGNTVLYGATGGELFVAGRAGERFGVRNSGASAVVEGVGDHGCEYMTGGAVVVLGPIGHNFGAGMTGGAAYVFDQDGRVGRRVNSQLVSATVPSLDDLEVVRALVERHAQLTQSRSARAVLADWARASAQFLKIAPGDHPATIMPAPVSIPVMEGAAASRTP